MLFIEGINIERNVYMHEENGQKKLYIYLRQSVTHDGSDVDGEKNLLLVY